MSRWASLLGGPPPISEVDRPTAIKAKTRKIVAAKAISSLPMASSTRLAGSMVFLGLSSHRQDSQPTVARSSEVANATLIEHVPRSGREAAQARIIAGGWAWF